MSEFDDDDLAAAFDDEFDDNDGEELNGDTEQDGDEGQFDEPASQDPDDGGDGGKDSDSDLDLDEFAEKSIAELEDLSKEAGIDTRPPKRQRVSFGAVTEMQSPGDRDEAGPSGSGRGVAGGGSKAACAHPVWVFDMCGLCGISKEAAAQAAGQEEDKYSRYLSAHAGGAGQVKGGAGRAGGGGSGDGVVRLKHLHASAAVEISAGEAERIRKGTVTRLLSRRRLILILDLDHTLLNSVHLAEVGEDAAPKLAELQQQEEEAGLGARRLLHCLAGHKLWTKLRPGVFEFLEGLRDAYEMHIYTMGDKTYAAEVRRLLDPTGRLFSSVVAKDHSTQATAKHLDVLLSADELALVLDDTEAVWPGHRRNLLQIQRYHFFPSDLRKWGADGTALLEQGRDESATEGSLATLMGVLKRVHTRFFSTEDASLPPLAQRDVREVLAQERGRVLQGCRLLFSRCWAQDKDPRREPLWQLAESLGATCQAEYDPATTTHVVAAAGGTAKVHHARANGTPVVLPAWLQACSFRWQRVPEADFPVPDPQPGEGQGARAGKDGRSGPAGNGGALASAGLSEKEQLRIALNAAGGGGGREEG